MRSVELTDVLLAMRGRHVPDVDQSELALAMSRTLRAMESQVHARIRSTQLGEAFK